jgi:hypothetical protein
MSRNLQIVDSNLGISANIKYEPLSSGEKEKLKVFFKSTDGKEVKLTTVGEDRKPVSTFRAYLDDSGREYAKAELVAFDESTSEQLSPYEATTVFDIIKYEPLDFYTDRYVVEKYYELFPSDNGKKKEIDRKIAVDINLQGMKKLWDYLIENQVVAKAEFLATAGYRPGAGYIRAIKINGSKWTLELGVFKEEKIYNHIQERDMQPVQVTATKANRKANALL